MKSKLFYGFAVTVITVLAAWNVIYISKTKGMSSLLLANIEALAQNEQSVGDCMLTYQCSMNWFYTCIVLDSNFNYVTYCPHFWGN